MILLFIFPIIFITQKSSKKPPFFTRARTAGWVKKVMIIKPFIFPPRRHFGLTLLSPVRLGTRQSFHAGQDLKKKISKVDL